MGIFSRKKKEDELSIEEMEELREENSRLERELSHERSVPEPYIDRSPHPRRQQRQVEEIPASEMFKLFGSFVQLQREMKTEAREELKFALESVPVQQEGQSNEMALLAGLLSGMKDKQPQQQPPEDTWSNTPQPPPQTPPPTPQELNDNDIANAINKDPTTLKRLFESKSITRKAQEHIVESFGIDQKKIELAKKAGLIKTDRK